MVATKTRVLASSAFAATLVAASFQLALSPGSIIYVPAPLNDRAIRDKQATAVIREKQFAASEPNPRANVVVAASDDQTLNNCPPEQAPNSNEDNTCDANDAANDQNLTTQDLNTSNFGDSNPSNSYRETEVSPSTSESLTIPSFDDTLWIANHGDDSSERSEAVRILGEIYPPNAKSALQGLTSDSLPDIRYAAVDQLWRVGAKNAADREEVIQTLRNAKLDNEDNIRELANTALQDLESLTNAEQH